VALGTALLPELNKRIRREVKSTNSSWRTDETYVRVAGRLTYLYLGVDSTDFTIDFLLSETRDLEAARRFFQKALAAPGHPGPRVITVDGNPSYPTVIQELKRAGMLGRRCRCRPVRYLNNIVEQGRRARSSDESTLNSVSGLLMEHGVRFKTMKQFI
jgi:transposase, IS6 family